MRISINTGFDSIVSSHSNSNNFVLNPSSNVPGSLIEFEEKKVADNSATSIIMSELAHVDFNVNHKPSMVETHLGSTGFVSTVKDFFKPASKEDDNIIDWGGSHTVYAFGKFVDYKRLLEEFNLVNDKNEALFKGLRLKYAKSGDDMEDFDSSYVDAVKNFLHDFKLAKQCYSSYPEEDKRVFPQGDEYKKFVKKMSGKPECIFNADGFVLSADDLFLIGRLAEHMSHIETMYCEKNCSNDLTDARGKFFIDFDISTKEKFESADIIYRRIVRGKPSKEDFDDVIGLNVLGIYSTLMNGAVCGVFMKCPDQISITYAEKYWPLDVEYTVGDEVKDRMDDRALVINDVITNDPNCDYYTWSRDNRRKFDQREWEVQDDEYHGLQSKSEYNHLFDVDPRTLMTVRDVKQWETSIEKLKKERDIYFQKLRAKKKN